MTSRAWSLRYALLRVANAHATATEQYIKAQGRLSWGEVARIARDALAARPALTTRLLFAGPAMAPTLNARAALAVVGGGTGAAAAAAAATPAASASASAAAAASASAAARDAVEGLLLWRDPPAIRVGDVVAFTAPPGVTPGYDAAAATAGGGGGTVVGGGGGGASPAAAAAAAAAGRGPSSAPSAAAAPPPPPTLVRRVAALGGEVLVDGDGPDAATYPIPPGHAWLLADAGGRLPLASAPDSRAFGPVPVSAILGRVIYAAASRADHGPVLSSSPASASDDAEVVAAELCVDDLAPPRPTPA